MSGFRLLRNTYSFTQSRGTSLVDPASYGSASLDFSGDSGSADLPVIGESLYEIDYYGSSGTLEYGYIQAKTIRQVPYGIDGTTEKFKYTVTYDSEDTVQNEFMDFISNLQPISLDNPANWRYVSVITDATPPITGTGFTGNVNQPLARIVTVGSFKQRKLVDSANLQYFFEQYQKLAGRLNLTEIYVFELSSSQGIKFTQGQVLVGALENGNKNEAGDYVFEVRFEYKLIGSKNGTKTEDIIDNDWQYVLAPVAGGDAGFYASIQLQADTLDTPISGSGVTPWIYEYTPATEGSSIVDFLEFDFLSEV